MNRRNLAPTLAWPATVLLIASACSTAGVPAPGVTAPPTTAAKPAPSGSDGPFADGGLDLLILHRADATATAGWEVVDTGSRRTLFSLPEGAVSADWHTLATATPDGDATRVRVMGAEGGDLRSEIRVPGAWRLPAIGVGGRPGGLSPDGSTLVLEEAVEAAPASATSRTRFAIVPTTGSPAPRVITLDGAFGYDALSAGGQWLYLIQHVAGADPTHYVVRRYDTIEGRLQADAIIDKLNADEQMNGYAVTQQPGPAGWVYTVYRGHDGAFVHALSTADGIAFCIDLPASADEDATTGAQWGLALDLKDSLLYAANPALHTVSEIDLGGFAVRRTERLASLPSIELAKFESAQPAGGRAAVSTDGTSLYVLEAHGIRVVRLADLSTTARLGGDTTFRSVAAGSGTTVYAVDDAGRAAVMDAVSGTSYPVGEARYTSIVAVVPLR